MVSRISRRILLCLLMLALLCCGSALAEEKSVVVSTNLETVDGQLAVKANQIFSLSVSVDTDGLTALRVFDGEAFQYINYWEEWGDVQTNGVLSFDMLLGSGQKELFAQAYYGPVVWDENREDGDPYEPLWNEEDPSYLNWNNNGNVVGSDHLTLDVTADGELTAPTAELASGAEYTWGDYILVNVSNFDDPNADYTYAMVGQNGSWKYGRLVRDNGQVLLPTIILEPGEGQVKVVSQGKPGYDDGEADVLTFTLNAAQTEAGSVYFNVDRTEILSGESLGFSGYAEGAAYYCLHDGESLQDWEPNYSNNGFAAVTYPDHAVTNAPYRLYAYDAEGNFIGKSEPIAVTVNVLGDTTAPTLEVPDAIQPGEDLNITINLNTPEDRNVGWWDLYVTDLNNGWQDIQHFNLTDLGIPEFPATYTLDGSSFPEEGNYRVTLYVREDGYNGNEAARYIQVSRNETDAERVSVSVTQNGEPVSSVLAYTEFEVHVNAPGATMVSLFITNDLMECTPVDDQGHFIWRGTWGYDPYVSIVANATFDEIPEGDGWNPSDLTWYRSEVVDLAVLKNGQVAPFELSVPETVTLGSPVTVGIDGLANAWVVDARIAPADDMYNDIENVHIESDNGQDLSLTEVTIPTGRLEIGRAYYVSVWAGGKPGYQETETPRNEYSFTLEAPDNDGFLFTVDTTEGVNHQTFQVTAYAPGADEIKLYYNGGEWRDEDGSIERFDDGHITASEQMLTGETYVYGEAYYSDGRVERSETITLTATEQEWENPLSISVDGLENGIWSWNQEDSLMIRFEGDPLPMTDAAHQERWWTVYVHDDTDGYNLRDFNIWDGAWQMQDYTLTLNADELALNHGYHVNVNGSMRGYADYQADVAFLVTDQQNFGDVQLTINGNDTNAAARANEDFSIFVTGPENMTGFRVFSGGWDYFNRNDIGNSHYRSWDSGEYDVIAQITTDDYDESDGAWPEHVTWQNLSNTVHLSITSEGRVQPAGISLSGTEIARGDMLEVTIDPSDHASEYHVRIFDQWGNEQLVQFINHPLSEPLTLRLPTGGLNPTYEEENEQGETVYPPMPYRVSVWYRGSEGYDSNGAESEIFYVTEPEEPGFTLNISETECDWQDMVYVSAYYPGAAYFKVTHCDYEWPDPMEANNGGLQFELEIVQREQNFFLKAYDENGELLATSDEWQLYGAVYTMEPAVIEMDSDVVPTNQDVTFTVRNLPIGQDDASWDVNIWGEGDLNWSNGYPGDAQFNDDGSVTFTIPADRLEADRKYTIYAHVDKRAHEVNGENPVRLSFLASDVEATDTLKLYVNGVVTESEISNSQDCEVEVRHSGEGQPTAIRVMRTGSEWNTGWRPFELEEGQNTLRVNDYNHPEPGDHFFVAQASYQELPRDDNNDVLWDQVIWDGGLSNTVHMLVYSGQEAYCDLDIEGVETITRGDLLNVHVYSDEHIRQYHVYLRAENRDDNIVQYFIDNDGSNELHLQIPTDLLTPELDGETARYYVDVHFHAAPGYSCGGKTTDPFTVSAAETEGMTLNVSKDHGVYQEEIMVSAYHPDAVRFHVEYDNIPGDEYAENGGAIWYMRLADHEGDVVVEAYDGNDNLLESRAFTFFLDGEPGQLAQPVIHAERVYTLDSGDLTFSVENLNNEGNYWNVNVDYHGYGDQISWSNWNMGSATVDEETGAYVFTVPAGLLQAGEYHIGAGSNRTGWYGTYEQFNFVVMDTNSQNTVYLTLNGESEDLGDLPARTDYTLRIEAPGATNVKFYNPDWENWVEESEYNNLHQEEPGVWEFYDWFSSGEHEYVALASYDNGQTWTGVSNTVSAHVYSDHWVEPGYYELLSDSVARGEMLPVKVFYANGADTYQLRIYDLDHNERYFMDNIHVDPEQGYYDTGLPTGMLEPGEYLVNITTGAQDCDWTGSDLERLFTVNEPAEGITLSLSKTWGVNHEQLPVSLYYAGADYFKVFYSNSDNEWYHEPRANDGGAEVTLDLMASGDHNPEQTLYAQAFADGSDEPLAESEHIQLDVSGRGDLWVDVSAPMVANVNEEFTFTVEGVYDGMWYWNVGISPADNDQDLFSWGNNQGEPFQTTFTLPANTLEAGQRYIIHVWADEYNMFPIGKGYEIIAVDGSQTNVRVTVNGSDEAEQTIWCTDYNTEIRIEAPGAHGVRFYDSCRDEWIFPEFSDGVWVYRRDWNPGDYEIVAAASYEEDENDQPIWTGVSNRIALHVDTRGQLGTSTLDVSDTVVRGEKLAITVYPVENATEYHLRICDDNWNEVVFEAFHNESGEPFQAYLLTSGLEPGDNYHVYICYGAVGWNWNETRWDEENQRFYYPLTVMDSDECSLVLGKNEAHPGEEISFGVFAPGAERIRVRIDWADGEFDVREYEGQSVADRFLGDDWRETEYVFHADALYSGENEWQENVASDSLSVTFIGQTTVPESDLKAIYDINQPITVTFGGSDNVDWYKVMIVGYDGNGNAYWIVNRDFNAPGTYTITSDMYIEGTALVPGTVYGITVSAWKVGYEPAWTNQEFRFAYVDGSKVLKLPAALTEVEEDAFSGVPAVIVVVPNENARINMEAFSGSEVLVVVAPENAEIYGDYHYLRITPEMYEYAN